MALSERRRSKLINAIPPVQDYRFASNEEQPFLKIPT
jgi:hypothetical protein